MRNVTIDGKAIPVLHKVNFAGTTFTQRRLSRASNEGRDFFGLNEANFKRLGTNVGEAAGYVRATCALIAQCMADGQFEFNLTSKEVIALRFSIESSWDGNDYANEQHDVLRGIDVDDAGYLA